MGGSDGSPLWQARELRKSYGSVQALRGASFDLAAGEVVALIGDNGAGKSTLVKCLSGVERPDAGEIFIDGRRSCWTRRPPPVRAASIPPTRTWPSRPTSIPPRTCSSAARCCARGCSAHWACWTRPRCAGGPRTSSRASAVTLPDLDVPIGSLSGGQRQSVAVARSVVWASRKCSSTSRRPRSAWCNANGCSTLSAARARHGVAVVLISHNMPEVLAVADRIEVLRLGARVARFTAADATLEQLVGAMTGVLAHEEER